MNQNHWTAKAVSPYYDDCKFLHIENGPMVYLEA